MHSTPGHAVQKAVFIGIFFAHAMHIGGKRDEELILPLNSSLSATLDQNQVNTLEWMVDKGSDNLIILLLFLSLVYVSCNVHKGTSTYIPDESRVSLSLGTFSKLHADK